MKTRIRRISTRVVRDVRDEVAAFSGPVAFGVSAAGEWLLAGRIGDAQLRDERGFPKSMLDELHEWRVLRGEGSLLSESIRIVGERTSFQFVQPLSEGVLLVGPRCAWRSDGPETNAAVFDAAGSLIRRLTLGDGIEDVRTTPAGAIWVSYFDEGVFGNLGWGRPGPAPLGQSGLVRFDGLGQPRESYDAERASTDAICDAYATNVDARGVVHVYFYTEFPIVRLRDGEYTRWKCGISGARALAVRDDRALLVGSYGQPSQGRILELRSDGQAAEVEECTVTTPEGDPIASMRVASVGPDIYFFDGARILQLEKW